MCGHGRLRCRIEFRCGLRGSGPGALGRGGPCPEARRPRRLRPRPGPRRALVVACAGSPPRPRSLAARPRRLRAQPADPLARGRADRARVRRGPRLQRRRRRHRVPGPRPRPPAVRAQRRDRPRRDRLRHRRIRGQRPDAAPAHPARGQARAPRRHVRRAQPHPGQPRRDDEVPVARAATGRTRRGSSASTRRRPAPSSTGSARAPSRAAGASRPRSWTGPTTSPTPCTTSRTPSPRAGSTRACSARATWPTSIGVAGRTYAPDLGADALGGALERAPRLRSGARRHTTARGGDLARAQGHDEPAHRALRRSSSSRPPASGTGPGRCAASRPTSSCRDETRAECSVLKAVANHFVMTTDERLARAWPSSARSCADARRGVCRRPDERLDPDLPRRPRRRRRRRRALRVVVDQVASLTDVRALALHRQWCR